MNTVILSPQTVDTRGGITREEPSVVITCPKCSQEGILRRKVNKVKIKKSLKSDPKNDHFGNPIKKEPIGKRFHPYKWASMFGLNLGRKKQPIIINPPKPQPKETELSRAWHDLGKQIQLLAKMIPKIRQKYSSGLFGDEFNKIFAYFDREFTYAIFICTKYLEPAIDDRFHRSWDE